MTPLFRRRVSQLYGSPNPLSYVWQYGGIKKKKGFVAPLERSGKGYPSPSSMLQSAGLHANFSYRSFIKLSFVESPA